MEGESQAYAPRNSTKLEGDPMYGRPTASAFALGSTPPIVGCGNSTITIAQTSSDPPVSGVIPSDRTGVSSIEKQGERGEDVKTREASR
jgi:hypothetical protein